MKKLSLFTLFCLLFVTIQANASPELSLNTTTISPGDSATLILSISNAPDCAGINAKILLPDGLSVKSISKGTLLPASFTTDFKPFSDAQGQGIYVLAYSNLDTFTNASGELLKINLETTDNIVGGHYNIPFANSNSNTLVNARYAVSNRDGTCSLNTSAISGNINILPVIAFTKATQSVTENAGTVTITASMNCTSQSLVTVPFTVSGTSDNHNLSNGTLTIEPGKTSGIIQFELQDDQNNESEETVIVTMDEPSGAKWGNTTIHVINIIDDDNNSIANQIVSLSPDNLTINPNDEFKIIANYDITDNNQSTSSLGIRIHFDSQKLELKGVDHFFSTGSLNDEPVVQNETIEQSDENPLTDKIVLLSYAGIKEGWPGQYYLDKSFSPPQMCTITLPLNLITLTFVARNTLRPAETTSINVSQITGDTAYGFQANGSTIKLKPYNLDVDQNGSVDGGTDGLLLIRYLFENTGENLVNSVVAQNCNRCEPMDIENYLNDAKSAILDVDGNGQADGGTDGLLLIRYTFENRGENLIRGVVASDCTRCTAEEIENYLAPLCP